MIPTVTNPLGITDPRLRQLDYITKASGNTVIDTGFTFSGNVLKYDVTMDLNGVAYGSIIGNWNGSTRDMYILIRELNCIRVHVALSAPGTDYYLSPGSFHRVQVTADNTAKACTVDIDGVAAGYTFSGSCVSGMPLTVDFFQWKMKSYRILQDGVIVRDLIPVTDMQGRECVYDTVKRKFYQI
jgi:hypothetical protein